MAIPFLTEHFANWSRKSSCTGSQRCRAVLGKALEAKGSRKAFCVPLGWQSKKLSHPGSPVFGEGEKTQRALNPCSRRKPRTRPEDDGGGG